MMEASHDHRTLYWIVGIVAVVLCIIGLITYSGQKDTQQAQDKAAQLTQKFKAAGLEVPVNNDVFVRTLGADGGVVCDNPASALGRATLLGQLVNGASFVGQRPIIADRNVIKGEALILQTYCPEKLQEYKDKFDDLKTDDTLKD
jgi:hypothetical protein